MLSSNTMLRELADRFYEYEEQFRILSWIDTALARNSLSIDQFFQELFVNLRPLFHARNIGAYAVCNKLLLPFSQTNDHPVNLPVLTADGELPDEVLQGKVLALENQPNRAAGNTLFIPVEFDESVSFLLVIQDDLPTGAASRLHTEDTHRFAENLSRQISIFCRHRVDNQIENTKSALLTSFFNNQLAPARCWQALVNKIPEFLPDFGPLKIDPPPKVQLLTHLKDDKYLLLRGTQDSSLVLADTDKGAITNARPLKVEDTICGLIIEQKKNLIDVNPQKEYEGRYQAYLFGSKVPKSELVLGIPLEEDHFALLNLEHKDENVFYPYHIRLLQEVGSYLSPFLNALLNREQRQKGKEISLLYVMTKFLRRLASLHRHRVKTLILNSRSTINNLRKDIPETQEKAFERLQNLGKFIDEFQKISNSFLEDIPEYVRYAPVDLCKQIDEAKKEFDPEALAREGISFDDAEIPKSIPEVYASRMLKEHIYNLLSNSYDAVKKAHDAGSIAEGIIRIAIRTERTEDGLKKQTSPSKIILTVEDNGGGVDPKVYPRILEFGFTTKRGIGGTGFGLPAAKEYMESVGGGLHTINAPGKGFAVVCFLQEFVPDYHERLSEQTLFKGD